jgi:AraC-like DNA-binding protein
MGRTGGDWQLGVPAPALRPWVRRYVGYRLTGPEGVHRGLPNGRMTFIVSLGADIEVAAHVDPRQLPGAYSSVLGGLHTAPALIRQGGEEVGLAIDLGVLGSRMLLGCPARELAHLTIEGDDLLGGLARELQECTHGRPWPEVFRIADTLLARRLGDASRADRRILGAWHLLESSHGRARVGEVATAVGWSRRHLADRFHDEFGLAPKAAARALRFGRVVEDLRRAPHRSLAEVAATAGYADQAHLTREFVALAGCTPTTWLAEEFPSVQDADPRRVGG